MTVVNTPYRDNVRVSATYWDNVEVGDFVDVVLEKSDGTSYTEREEVLEIVSRE